MATPAYTRIRLFWGAFDETIVTPQYSSAQHVSMGPSAAAGSGVGVRHASVQFKRTPPGTTTDDSAYIHFDFVNITGGVPDDTWTTADYTAMDTAFNTFLTALKPFVSVNHIMYEVRYYRTGTGVVPPQPPEHIFTPSLPGTASSADLPPQCAATVSFHTGARRSWGRTYLPGLTVSSMSSPGVLSNAYCDGVAGVVNTFITSLAASDFKHVVVSDHLGSALQVEAIAVDNIVDIIRRRRWRHSTYRKTYP